MTRIFLARIVLAFVGIVVWGYGANVDSRDVRWAGIAILAVSLLLRFVPKRWLGEGKGAGKGEGEDKPRG
jgi:uncharacterized protein YqgC (DUF456 family)